MGKGVTHAAACLENLGSLVQRVKDGVQVVVWGDHKAGRELLECCPGVHQRGGVGDEFQQGHGLIESVRCFRRIVAILGLGSRHVVRHAAEHLFRRLDDLSLIVPQEVPRR
jgi:hypothetical protein